MSLPDDDDILVQIARAGQQPVWAYARDLANKYRAAAHITADDYFVSALLMSVAAELYLKALVPAARCAIRDFEAKGGKIRGGHDFRIIYHSIAVDDREELKKHLVASGFSDVEQELEDLSHFYFTMRYPYEPDSLRKIRCPQQRERLFQLCNALSQFIEHNPPEGPHRGAQPRR